MAVDGTGNVIVLAISGPSASGKTTLAGLLRGCLDTAGVVTRLFHQDHYFNTPRTPSYWGAPNKDTPESVDMQALHRDVLAAIADMERTARADMQSAAWAETDTVRRAASAPVQVLILEGFLLLQDAPLMELASAMIFLRVSQQVI